MQPEAVPAEVNTCCHAARTPGASKAEACTAATAAIRELGKKRAWESAIAKARELQLRLVQTDTVLHNALISSCERAKRWAKALCALSALGSLDLAADIASFGTALSACSKKTIWARSTYYLEASRRQQLQPNIISYNTALNSAIRATSWRHSCLLFHRLLQASLAPSTITCNSAMMSYMAVAAWQRALSSGTLMSLRRVAPDEVTSGVFVKAFASNLEWEVCLLALDPSAAAYPTSEPNEVVINAALGSCAGEGKWRIAFLLLEAVRGFSLKGDSVTFSSASASCSSVQEWERAMSVFQEAAETNVSDANLMDAAIRDVSRASRWEKTRSLLKAMHMHSMQADAPRSSAEDGMSFSPSG